MTVSEQHKVLRITAGMMCFLWGSLLMLWVVHASWSCISYTARISFWTGKMEWNVRAKNCRKTWDKAGKPVVLSYCLIISHNLSHKQFKANGALKTNTRLQHDLRTRHAYACTVLSVYTLLVLHVSETVYFLSSSELPLFHLDRIKVFAQTALWIYLQGSNRDERCQKTTVVSTVLARSAASQI